MRGSACYDLLEDPRVESLPPCLLSHYLNILRIARACQSAYIPSIQMLARFLKVRPSRAKKLVTQLLVYQVLDVRDGEILVPESNWKRRSLDLSTERTRHWRERQRARRVEVALQEQVLGDQETVREGEPIYNETENSAPLPSQEERLRRHLLDPQPGESREVWIERMIRLSQQRDSHSDVHS